MTSLMVTALRRCGRRFSLHAPNLGSDVAATALMTFIERSRARMQKKPLRRGMRRYSEPHERTRL